MDLLSLLQHPSPLTEAASSVHALFVHEQRATDDVFILSEHLSLFNTEESCLKAIILLYNESGEAEAACLKLRYGKEPPPMRLGDPEPHGGDDDDDADVYVDTIKQAITTINDYAVDHAGKTDALFRYSVIKVKP